MPETCVSPSSIHFTDCSQTLPQPTDEPKFEEISRKFSENRPYPKLQVVQKDGHLFTLNNTQLHVYRRLEETGVCGRVQVAIVPTNNVPEGIRNMMVVPKSNTNTPRGADDTSRKTCKGYEEVAQGESEDAGSSDESESSQDVYEPCASSEAEDWSCDDKADQCHGSDSSDHEGHSFL